MMYELSRDLRWRDASFEDGSNRVQLSRRQRNGGIFDPPLEGCLILDGWLPAASYQFCERRRR
jgi:hypothetical protein